MFKYVRCIHIFVSSINHPLSNVLFHKTVVVYIKEYQINIKYIITMCQIPGKHIKNTDVMISNL